MLSWRWSGVAEMLNAIKLVFLKEFIEARRDRRSLMVVLILSMIMPVSMLAALHFSASVRGEANTLVYGIDGAEHDPKLVSFLNARGIKTDTESSDATRVTLTIPPDYQLLMREGRVPSLFIEADFSRFPEAVETLRGALHEYGNEIVGARMIARGVSPVILTPLLVNVVDTGEISLLTRYLAPSIVFVFLLVPIYILMPTAIDSTAGERERHGTFPLLLQPLPAISITVGKFMMLVSAGLAGLAVAVVVGFVAFTHFSPPGINFGFDMSVLNGFLFLLVGFPSIMLLAAMMMAFASFAKTFKEGQSYVGMGSLVPLAFIGLGFALDDHAKAYVPFWAEQNVIAGFLSGDPVSLLPWLVTSFGYLIVIVLSLFWMSRTMLQNALKGQ